MTPGRTSTVSSGTSLPFALAGYLSLGTITPQRRHLRALGCSSDQSRGSSRSSAPQAGQRQKRRPDWTGTSSATCLGSRRSSCASAWTCPELCAPGRGNLGLTEKVVVSRRDRGRSPQSRGGRCHAAHHGQGKDHAAPACRRDWRAVAAAILPWRLRDQGSHSDLGSIPCHGVHAPCSNLVRQSAGSDGFRELRGRGTEQPDQSSALPPPESIAGASSESRRPGSSTNRATGPTVSPSAGLNPSRLWRALSN